MVSNKDVAVIGGGIVGLATAYQLTQRFPSRSVVVLEKEPDLAMHQSGRNSGVLHSGIYYQPGSMKARNCRAGKKAMVRFCEEEGIRYDLCGKVIVATDDREISTLNMIYERGQANGVRCQRINEEQLKELEPHAAGVAAIHVPEAGIVDYRQVCRRLADRIRERGGAIKTGAAVHDLRPTDDAVVLETAAGQVMTSYVINCAGLYSDRLLELTGARADVKIVPFRGEYYKLRPQAEQLCNGLIYPVPDPAFPFLGVHFTRRIHGGVECGPNAVLAFAREGYDKKTVNLSELAETLAYPGFLKLAYRYWRTGLAEMWRSFSKASFARTLQKLIPEVEQQDLEPAPAGVRAQAITPDGQLLDDFLIQETDRIINMCNAPSPAATASLNIGNHIVDKLSTRFD